MFTNILVPLDGSPVAEKVLSVAAMLARTRQGSLTLVRVVNICTELWSQPHQHAKMVQSSVEAEKEQATEYLKNQASSLLLNDIPVEVDVRWGPVVPSIFEAVQHFGCDLIVLGQKKQRGPLHMFPGSESDHIVTNSPVPVLLVHEEGPFPVFPYPPGDQPVRLLIGIDDLKQKNMVFNATESMLKSLPPSLQVSIHFIKVTTPFSHENESDYRQSMQETTDTIKGYLGNRMSGPLETNIASFENISRASMSRSVVVESDCVRALVDETERAKHHEESDTKSYHVMVISSLFGQPTEMNRPVLSSILERLIRETHLPILIVPPKYASEAGSKATFLGTVYL